MSALCVLYPKKKSIIIIHYVNGLNEQVERKPDDINIVATKERHHIGGFAILAIEGRTATHAGRETTRYLHKDHIGSVTAISDDWGLVETFSFDPWCKRRAINADDLEFLHGPWTLLHAYQKDNLTTNALELTSLFTNGGYTGHEHLGAVGLIHMNGRIYDPSIGQFLSADPLVHALFDLQSYNRYAYVRNNPLCHTDLGG